MTNAYRRAFQRVFSLPAKNVADQIIFRTLMDDKYYAHKWLTHDPKPSHKRVASVMVALIKKGNYQISTIKTSFTILASDPRLTDKDWQLICSHIRLYHMEQLSEVIVEPTFPAYLIKQYVLEGDIVTLRNALNHVGYVPDEETWHHLIQAQRPMVVELALQHATPTWEEIDMLMPDVPTIGMLIFNKPYVRSIITWHGNRLSEQQWKHLMMGAHPSMVETITLSRTAPAWVLREYAAHKDPAIRRNVSQNPAANEETRILAALTL